MFTVGGCTWTSWYTGVPCHGSDLAYSPQFIKASRLHLAYPSQAELMNPNKFFLQWHSSLVFRSLYAISKQVSYHTQQLVRSSYSCTCQIFFKFSSYDTCGCNCTVLVNRAYSAKISCLQIVHSIL